MNAANISEARRYGEMFEACTDRISADALSIAEETQCWTIVLNFKPGSPLSKMSLVTYYFRLEISDVMSFYHETNNYYNRTILKFSPSKSFFNCQGTSTADCPADSEMHLHGNIYFDIFFYTYDIEKPMTCSSGENLTDMPTKIVFVGAEKHAYAYNIDNHQLFSLSDVNLDILLFNGSRSELDIYVLKSQTCVSTKEKCPKKQLRPEMFQVLHAHTPNESIILSNGMLLTKKDFILKDNDGILEVSICADKWNNLVQNNLPYWKLFLVVIGTAASIISLIMTILTIARFENMKNTPGLIVLNLSTTLLFAQTFYCLMDRWAFNEILCQVMAALQHLLWLLVFGWTAVLARDMQRAFLGLLLEQSNIIVKYSIFVWGLGIGITAPCLTLSLYKWPIYGSGAICWLTDRVAFIVGFMTPVCLMSVWNLAHFVRVIIKLRNAMDETKRIANREKLDEVMIYFRISSLLGFNWIIGIIATFANVDWLWVVFDVVNTLQGVGIFLAVVVRKRVLHMYRMSFTDMTTVS